MPIHRATKDGKPAMEWGHGAKYTYKAGSKSSMAAARRKANKQSVAAHAHGYGSWRPAPKKK